MHAAAHCDVQVCCPCSGCFQLHFRGRDELDGGHFSSSDAGNLTCSPDFCLTGNLPTRCQHAAVRQAWRPYLFSLQQATDGSAKLTLTPASRMTRRKWACAALAASRFTGRS